MELKKSPKANLEKHKVLFLEIGLAVVLVVSLLAFEWGTQELSVQELTFADDIVEMEEIPQTEHEEVKPPEAAPIPVVSDVMVIVDNNVVLADNDMDLFADSEDRGQGIALHEYYGGDEEEEAVEEDIPFTAVEEPASFNGKGVDGFRQWIAENMKYPEVASENGIQGRVTMQFTVDKDGKVVNVKVLRGVDPALDKEAIRVISASPKWKPGKQRDKAVRVLYTVPVIFRLQ